MPLVATIVLWQLADFFIYPLFYVLAGEGWFGFLLRTSVSAAIGFPLYALLVSTFAEVEVANEVQSAP